jgi:hypothetical protein
MTQLFTAHPFASALAAYYFLSGLVAGMPPLGTGLSAKEYFAHWGYDSLHIWTNMASTAIRSKFPNAPVIASASTVDVNLTQVQKQEISK